MIFIPIETPDHKSDAVICVLNSSNLERMKKADPSEIILKQSGRNLVNPTILLCFEEDNKELAEVINSGDVAKIIKYLQRGWKFRPDKGDHDRGPESIRNLQ